MGGVLKMIGGLTKKGGAGDGSDGFMQLLQGAGGGSGGTKMVNMYRVSKKTLLII